MVNLGERSEDDQRNCTDDADRLGIATEESKNLGNEQNSAINSHSKGGYSSPNGDDTNQNGGGREISAGGILRQLRELQQAHLAYVNDHSERLKMRLSDDETHRQAMIERMRQLEKDIVKKLGESREEQSGEGEEVS